MGNSCSNITRIYPTLHRTVFFPGNCVTGTLTIECKDEVKYSCVAVCLVGELQQSFFVCDRHVGHHAGGTARAIAALVSHSPSHKRRQQISTPIGEVSCTILGSPGQSNGSYRLSKGVHVYDWAFMLPPGVLPSARIQKSADGTWGSSFAHADETASALYYVTAEVQVDGKSAKQGSVPIHILFPIAASEWIQPSAIRAPFTLDLTTPRCFCFSFSCCCERGVIAGTAEIRKTVVALDREEDSVAFSVTVDATKCNDPVEFVTVSLIAQCSVKVGTRPIRFQSVVSSQKIKCGVQPGASGVISGTLPLGANRPPTIQSSIIDVSYKCCFEFDVAWSTSIKSEVDIVVAHSVDETNASAMLRQMQRSCPQMGRQQVPNLLNPLYRKYCPSALQGVQFQQLQPQQNYGDDAPENMTSGNEAEVYTQSDFAVTEADQLLLQQYRQQQQQFSGIAAFPSEQLAFQSQ